MLRMTHVIRAMVLVGVILYIDYTDKMKKKHGSELVIGWVLVGCEYVSIMVELMILGADIHAHNTFGCFARMYAQLMINTMVAAQMVYMDRIRFLYAAIPVTGACALFIACCARNPDDFEVATSFMGLACDLGPAVGFQGLDDFKSSDEVYQYAVLFALNVILPWINRRRYEGQGHADNSKPSEPYHLHQPPQV